MLDIMLDRIGYRGPVSHDLATLTALHRAWRQAVPYENLDIQLGRGISLDEDALFDKLILRRRGGYCYEHNGVLAMLLRTAGFTVTMVEGAVLRETRGEAAWGNHNVLLVDIDDQRWLADAGIGDGFLEPLPLRAGPHQQDDLVYRLEQLDPDTWRFHHHPGGTIASYDFHLNPRQLSDFAEYSHTLSTSPQSAYVTTLIVARPVAVDHTLLLLSRTLRHLGATDRSPRAIDSRTDFADLLQHTFHVPLDDLGPGAVEFLWTKTGGQDDLWRARLEQARG